MTHLQHQIEKFVFWLYKDPEIPSEELLNLAVWYKLPLMLFSAQELQKLSNLKNLLMFSKVFRENSRSENWIPNKK